MNPARRPLVGEASRDRGRVLIKKAHLKVVYNGVPHERIRYTYQDGTGEWGETDCDCCQRNGKDEVVYYQKDPKRSFTSRVSEPATSAISTTPCMCGTKGAYVCPTHHQVRM